MPRYKLVNGENIQLTAEEEAARDAEEAAWEAGAFDRAMADLRQKRNRLSGTGTNRSGATFIYMAFAESPFVTSTGIPTTAR